MDQVGLSFPEKSMRRVVRRRTQAEHMHDVDARTTMRGIAESYDKLARPAEERAQKPED